MRRPPPLSQPTRPRQDHIASCSEGGAVGPYQGLRVVTWNVERGYRLGAVLEELRGEQPDLVLLQEVDYGCRRSFSNDVGGEV